MLMEYDVTTRPTGAGTSPFAIACLNGSMDVIEVLVENGADVNEEPSVLTGFNPIIAAAYRHHTDVVKFLLRQGADPFLYPHVRK